MKLNVGTKINNDSTIVDRYTTDNINNNVDNVISNNIDTTVDTTTDTTVDTTVNKASINNIINTVITIINNGAILKNVHSNECHNVPITDHSGLP